MFMSYIIILLFSFIIRNLHALPQEPIQTLKPTLPFSPIENSSPSGRCEGENCPRNSNLIGIILGIVSGIIVKNGNNQSLTKRLIDLSNTPSRSSLRFAHTPEWADGLDSWTFAQNLTIKSDLSRRNFDFHDEIGMYLPRYEKPKSAPNCLKNLQMNSKITQNNLPPERIQHLLKREKDLLLQIDLSDQTEIPIKVPTNTFRSSTSLDLISTNENKRRSFHQTTTTTTTPDQDVLKNLLEEHLTSLLTRGASTINGNRITSIESKQIIRSDSKLNDKRDEIMSTPLSTVSTSHFIVQQKSPLGLAITPLDVSPQRNFQSVSLEKLAQQRSFHQENELLSPSTTNSTRPSTEPVAFPPPTHRYQQQQKVVLKRNLETTNSSSGDLYISNENTNKLSEQNQMIQNFRKGHTHHGITTTTTAKSKNSRANRTTTIELLPPIVSGKRVHISLANHRYL
ncbi:hypothetical protein I4U23_027052 [Adineta vaga]|nr:hypothetical protein I4U23_027052 [Adineta vaga]